MSRALGLLLGLPGWGRGNVSYQPIIHDEFTGSNGTALTSHTIAPINTPGSTWSKLGQASTALSITSNKAVKTAVNNDHALAVVDVQTATYRVQAAIVAGGAINPGGLAVRIVDISNFFGLRTNPTTNAFELYKRVGGTFTLLDSVAYVFDQNTAYAVALDVSPTGFVGYLDGVAVVSADDNSTNQTNTVAGMWMFTTAATFDDFKVFLPPFDLLPAAGDLTTYGTILYSSTLD